VSAKEWGNLCVRATTPRSGKDPGAANKGSRSPSGIHLRPLGTRTFYTSDPTDSMGSLYERDDTVAHDHRAEYKSIEVEASRVDDFVKKHGINRIDFMKMDLEGAELEALRGATESMQTGLLRALSFEFGVSNVNSRTYFRDYFRLLSEYGYKLFRMTPAGYLIHVAEYSEDLEFFARTTTYFAKKT
jgi:hypothetical protein